MLSYRYSHCQEGVVVGLKIELLGYGPPSLVECIVHGWVELQPQLTQGGRGEGWECMIEWSQGMCVGSHEAATCRDILLRIVWSSGL